MCFSPRVLDVVLSCAEDLPLAVLLLFCSEGDNIPDAFTLVNRLNDWLHLLVTPVSGKRVDSLNYTSVTELFVSNTFTERKLTCRDLNLVFCRNMVSLIQDKSLYTTEQFRT